MAEISFREAKKEAASCEAASKGQVRGQAARQDNASGGNRRKAGDGRTCRALLITWAAMNHGSADLSRGSGMLNRNSL
jgi:hypothetical protein